MQIKTFSSSWSSKALDKKVNEFLARQDVEFVSLHAGAFSVIVVYEELRRP